MSRGEVLVRVGLSFWLSVLWAALVVGAETLSGHDWPGVLFWGLALAGVAPIGLACGMVEP